jgi:hypothetical protein
MRLSCRGDVQRKRSGENPQRGNMSNNQAAQRGFPLEQNVGRDEMPNTIWVYKKNAHLIPGPLGTKLQVQLHPDRDGEFIEYRRPDVALQIGDLDPVLRLVQDEEISIGKARDYIDAWMQGRLEEALTKDGR